MFNPTARIIADSVNTNGDRLTTYVLTYHRMIHSEFMTHRMLSKNSSSSRAIPVEKMIAKVESEMIYPIHWGKNQKGMVALEEIDESNQLEAAEIWDEARCDAIKHARRLVGIGTHKQVVNRLLEPFSSITVICSGTTYQNFFNQRCHPNAQPEIKALADAMKFEYEKSEPSNLRDGDWHIPFGSTEGLSFKSTGSLLDSSNLSGNAFGVNISRVIQMAVGRCARVSYLNHDGKRDLDADIALHDRLLTSKPAHLSPFEHVAIALPNSEQRANFTGFESYRYQLEHKNV